MKSTKYIIMSILAILGANMVSADAKASYMKDTYLTVGAGRSKVAKKIEHLQTPVAGNEVYQKEKLKDANVFKVAAGKDYGNVRTEIEFMFGDKHKFSNAVNGVKSAFKVDHKTVFLNTFYTFTNNKTFKPYIGFGLGASRNELKAESISYNGVGFKVASGGYDKKNKTSFAYNLSVGALMHVNDSIYFDLSYKYADLGKLKGSNVKILNVATANDTFSTRANTTENVKGRLRSNIFMLGIGFKI